MGRRPDPQPLFGIWRRYGLGQANAGLAFAISMIAALLLFNPTRKQIQHLIDRRFFGFRFDLNELAAAQNSPDITNSGALTGRVLGKYRVLGLLGKGGMGEVYLAQDNQQTVAIKILPDDLALQGTLRKRFEREAQTLTTLDHPNIVKVYRYGESEGIHYMAMEYIEGQELGAIIKQRGKLRAEELHPFASDFAATLGYAHGCGLVHRDIKPSNIMLRRELPR
jgi:serine/threonine protein kinase